MFVDPRSCHLVTSIEEGCGLGQRFSGDTPARDGPHFWDITETEARFSSTKDEPFVVPFGQDEDLHSDSPDEMSLSEDDYALMVEESDVGVEYGNDDTSGSTVSDSVSTDDGHHTEIQPTIPEANVPTTSFSLPSPTSTQSSVQAPSQPSTDAPAELGQSIPDFFLEAVQHHELTAVQLAEIINIQLAGTGLAAEPGVSDTVVYALL
jgi:hypothetical protein